jgi:acyl-CoA thioester hydrolase
MTVTDAFSDEFTLEITAAPADIDENGHVSNLVYLRWVLEVARAHSESCGWPHGRFLESGAIFVVRRHEIDYLAAAMEHDLLRVTTVVQGWSAATSQRRTRIVRAVDGRELARCVTTWAYVSTANGRPKRIPAELAEDFRRKR